MFDAGKCNIQFAVSVVSLKHINDENIAVTSTMTLDTGLLRPDTRNASYQVNSMPQAQEPCT